MIECHFGIPRFAQGLGPMAICDTLSGPLSMKDGGCATECVAPERSRRQGQKLEADVRDAAHLRLLRALLEHV